MKKTDSRGCFFASIIWLISAQIWFFWVKNVTIGVVWLCVAGFYLAVALVKWKKERENKESNGGGGAGEVRLEKRSNPWSKK